MINISVHNRLEKPKPYTLCLVFCDKLQPRICRYLDDTDQDIEEYGTGEGFYENNESFFTGKQELNDIIGWIDLKELHDFVKTLTGE